MTCTTGPEFRRFVKSHLENKQYHVAARLIVANPEFASPWWIKWAKEILAGSKKRIPTEREVENVPLLRDGDLFGVPLTTGKKRSVPRMGHGSD